MTAVAVILKGFPRLSETFIAQEICALERRGLELRIVSLRHPTDTKQHPVHREIRAPVRYLPEYLGDEPRRVWQGLGIARRLPGFARARAVWLGDLRRDPTPNRIRRFGQACVLAAELESDVGQIYAHFLHTPASVARYAALMRGLPWSCSAHAKDIWTTPEREIRDKLGDAAWTVTCTEAGLARLRALAPDPGRVDLVYHGLDLSRFPAAASDRPANDGSHADRPVVVLSVGRAVAKKGYDDLLRALSLLPDGLHWRLRHIGGGALSDALRAEAGRLGLAAKIEWMGAQPQEHVLAELRRADLFVLASRIARDGDRDGLPNVLLEAASQSLAIVATRVSGIPELVDDGETGLLSPPGDPVALAAALARGIGDPLLRARLGAAASLKVTREFSLAGNIDGIARRFGLADASPQAATCE